LAASWPPFADCATGYLRETAFNPNGAESVIRFFGFLLGAEFFDGGADVGFPGERFVLVRVVGREVGDGDVHLLEQFGGLGEFVAVHIRLAVGPGPPVGGQRVGLRLLGVAKGEPELGEEAMRGLAQLSQSLGLACGSTNWPRWCLARASLVSQPDARHAILVKDGVATDIHRKACVSKSGFTACSPGIASSVRRHRQRPLLLLPHTRIVTVSHILVASGGFTLCPATTT